MFDLCFTSSVGELLFCVLFGGFGCWVGYGLVSSLLRGVLHWFWLAVMVCRGFVWGSVGSLHDFRIVGGFMVT